MASQSSRDCYGWLALRSNQDIMEKTHRAGSWICKFNIVTTKFRKHCRTIDKVMLASITKGLGPL